MSDQLKAERALLSPPGDDILETIEHIKMSQAELADRLGKNPSKVHDLITGKEPITYTTALQLEKVLGIDAQFWLNREMNYRTKLARIMQEEEMEETKEWLKQQPIKELKLCGYIKAERPGAAMVAEALEFYGVVNTEKWQSRYIDEHATAAYRKSEAHQTALGSIAAWLRIGELEMQKLQLPAYDKDIFKTVLEEIKELVVKQPGNFAKQLQQQCAKAGVAVVYTMCLPKAPVSGATRWFRSNPMIQLTDRHKTNDHFWFTFFHEAGHVLLHGKKEVFFEEFEGYKPDNEKEEEANRFAAKQLLSDKFEDELPFKITDLDAVEIAARYNTHPAIVIGRLQHKKLLKYTFGNEHKVKVDLFK
jgi:HTH-type transcriptional regulator/antitoxin HigA